MDFVGNGLGSIVVWDPLQDHFRQPVRGSVYGPLRANGLDCDYRRQTNYRHNPIGLPGVNPVRRFCLYDGTGLFGVGETSLQSYNLAYLCPGRKPLSLLCGDDIRSAGECLEISFQFSVFSFQTLSTEN